MHELYLICNDFAITHNVKIRPTPYNFAPYNPKSRLLPNRVCVTLFNVKYVDCRSIGQVEAMIRAV